MSSDLFERIFSHQYNNRSVLFIIGVTAPIDT